MRQRILLNLVESEAGEFLYIQVLPGEKAETRIFVSKDSLSKLHDEIVRHYSDYSSIPKEIEVVLDALKKHFLWEK